MLTIVIILLLFFIPYSPFAIALKLSDCLSNFGTIVSLPGSLTADRGRSVVRIYFHAGGEIETDLEISVKILVR
ncbi:hypothetical protein VB711_06855 [Cronbergia sp. UHCC 0137]|uniref:hypothetical protein n=1 Tax=Cronbergia sp. UHCC 0137 TaxID=3110239 RepID=UPI002B201559|nr:hypothetical protein [Cronbergia sp. UHCC 0137]MEA5617558.1 hypothetical protein [Cronbergia sp. UHCC 0137]